MFNAATGFKPDGFLRLQSFTKHPVGEDGVHHCGEENFSRELENIVFVKRGTRYECRAEALAAVFESSPIILLGDEGDIVDDHEIEQTVDELCAVGTIIG